jgi:hypothetical protein
LGLTVFQYACKIGLEGIVSKRLASRISFEQGWVILYSRRNFLIARALSNLLFDLTYPQEEKRYWDGVVTRISLSLRPLKG